MVEGKEGKAGKINKKGKEQLPATSIFAVMLMIVVSSSPHRIHLDSSLEVC